jgi:hypothetical protein
VDANDVPSNPTSAAQRENRMMSSFPKQCPVGGARCAGIARPFSFHHAPLFGLEQIFANENN